MKAVNKFKKLVAQKRPPVMSSILNDGDSPRFSLPPLSMQHNSGTAPYKHKSQSVTTFDRRSIEGALAVEGVHREMDISPAPESSSPDGSRTTSSPTNDMAGDRSKANSSPPPHTPDPSQDLNLQAQVSRMSSGIDDDDNEAYHAFRPDYSPTDPDRARSYDEAGHRGHAHDPLEDHLYLYIGPSTFSEASGNADRRATFTPDGEEDDGPIVSESPGAADIDIYETAYRDEIERIRKRCKEEGKDEEEPTVYLTRRVDARLLAIGQLAGRFKAKGEEGLDRFGAATGFKDRKARVTEVSRALRTAAREEYEKRRQERRNKDRAAATKAEETQPTPEANKSTKRDDDSKPPNEEAGALPEMGEAKTRTPSMFAQGAFAGRAMEKGRQAKTSFKSLMGRMKDSKGNASKEEDEAS
jgi:calcium/calmodulin-dependent protein kinase kinase 2